MDPSLYFFDASRFELLDGLNDANCVTIASVYGWNDGRAESNDSGKWISARRGEGAGGRRRRQQQWGRRVVKRPLGRSSSTTRASRRGGLCGSKEAEEEEEEGSDDESSEEKDSEECGAEDDKRGEESTWDAALHDPAPPRYPLRCGHVEPPHRLRLRCEARRRTAARASRASARPFKVLLLAG
jgi:hypothetical protein